MATGQKPHRYLLSLFIKLQQKVLYHKIKGNVRGKKFRNEVPDTSSVGARYHETCNVSDGECGKG